MESTNSTNIQNFIFALKIYYSAVVEINGIEYGRGVGSSKKEAKSEAARLSLEILIPEFKNNLNSKNGVVIKDSADLSVS